jgi:hypothetical protein
MITLAQKLGQTTPVSLLRKKATRLVIQTSEDALRLAASRGCGHYRPCDAVGIADPGRDLLPDDELAILLISGESAYDPLAIRCAAQLARSKRVDPRRLARLARLEKADRVLRHIARAGVEHDEEGRAFWQTVLDCLPHVPFHEEPYLPHWTRFVSMPGIQRHGPVIPRWLIPTE